jgi:hypothetical protein
MFKQRKSRKQVFLIAGSIVSAALVATTIALNALTWNGKLWSAVFAAFVLYAWGLGWITLKKELSLGMKLSAHAVAIALLLIDVNAFAFSQETVSHITWSVSYGMPIVFVSFLVVANILVVAKRHMLRDILLYQLAFCAAAFMPLILMISIAMEPIQPSIAAAFFSYLNVMGLIVFANRTIASEFGRKFHI